MLLDEVRELQVPLQELLEGYLGHVVQVVLGKHGQQEPDLVISIDGHAVCMLEAKTDASTNTRGQLQVGGPLTVAGAFADECRAQAYGHCPYNVLCIGYAIALKFNS